MEDLFSTQITVGDRQVPYRVIFDHEQYIFLAEGQKEHASFSFGRTHDEWHGRETLPIEIREQAIRELEKYLMRQH